MNQPCYNTAALERNQHEIDRQEAKEHWIAAAYDRIYDELLSCDVENDQYISSCIHDDCRLSFEQWCSQKAELQARSEYQQHLSALEQSRIDGMVSE